MTEQEKRRLHYEKIRAMGELAPSPMSEEIDRAALRRDVCFELLHAGCDVASVTHNARQIVAFIERDSENGRADIGVDEGARGGDQAGGKGDTGGLLRDAS